MIMTTSTDFQAERNKDKVSNDSLGNVFELCSGQDEVGFGEYRGAAKQRLERKNYKGGNNTIMCHADFVGTIYLGEKCSGVFGHWQ